MRGIAQALTFSYDTVANMKQNLTFASVYNAPGIPLAAGVLYPFTRGTGDEPEFGLDDRQRAEASWPLKQPLKR